MRVEGNAIVYCEGGYNTTNGKTAHGLVRFTERYRVLSVVDSRYAGEDAGKVLDGRPNGIPIFPDIATAVHHGLNSGIPASHCVVGLAPDGGRLPSEAREQLMVALRNGLHLDSGLHDFLGEDPLLAGTAAEHGAVIRDIRRTPPRESFHFFSGEIEEVDALKIAVLGTDSAVGKRTTAWRIVHAMRDLGLNAELIGTGQTAWLQGARYGCVMDSLINDFVSGEIEHSIVQAWREVRPDVLVIEGQGSLMNPAYPGGFEILAAGRPDVVVLQHAPRRLEYDGFPGYPLHPLPVQIQAVELISGKPVVAITVNHENMDMAEISAACEAISNQTGLPAFDVLVQDALVLARELLRHGPQLREGSQ